MTKRVRFTLGAATVAVTWLALLAACVRSFGLVVGSLTGIWGVSVPVAALMIGMNAFAGRPDRSQSQLGQTTQPAAA